MTSDDQQFLDTLASIPNYLRQCALDIPFADQINRQFDWAGQKLRDTLSSSPWLPDFIRPPAPPPPPPTRRLFNPSSMQRGGLYGILDWAIQNQVLVASTLTFLGTGGFLLYQRRKAYTRKRRAKKAANGARCEVVVVAGPIGSPLTRSIVLDLERRGFIVYVVTSSVSEEETIKKEGKSDILPMHLNVVDPADVDNTLTHFRRVLAEQHYPRPGSSPHNLNLCGVMLVPDMMYPSGPVSTVSPEIWSDAVNSKLLNTVAIAQAFLPVVIDSGSRFVVATPSIISSLRPPFHGVESTVVAAIEAFVTSLQGELATVGIPLVHLKMGSFDMNSLGSATRPLARDMGQEVLAWPSFARTAYAQNYLVQKGDARDGTLIRDFGRARRGKGSSLRELNNAVFDSLTRPRPWAVQRVGQGSVLYNLVGLLAPSGLVRWMMGMRSVSAPIHQELERKGSDSSLWEKVDNTP